jgi:diguanylate cyclase (GGDEF)-like protein
MSGASLICRDTAERGRMLDMSHRLRGAERVGIGVLMATMVLGIPVFGLLPLLPMLVAGAAFHLGSRRLEYARRPEYVLAGLLMFAQVMLGAAVVLAHGPSLYLLALFLFPTILASVVWPPRAAAVGVIFSALLLVATAFAADAHTVLHAPFSLLYPLAATVAAAIPAAAVRDLDAATRQTAVVDKLTGVLNRVALEARVGELTHQAGEAGDAITVLLGDVDDFKRINDTLGHAGGDAALREVASRLTAAMGDDEPVYRLGGEEFLVLLVGRSAPHGLEVAERLRAAVCASPVEDLEVTMSIGLATCAAGAPFDYPSVFARADAALYAAKREGRNRAVTAGQTGRDAASPDDKARTTHVITNRPAEHLGGNPHRRQDDEDAKSGSWLVRDDVEREHVLDLNSRIRESNHPAYLVAFATVIAAAFTYGWLTVVGPVIGAVVYNVVEHRLERFRRPEYALAAGWLFAQFGNAGGAAAIHFSSPDAPLYALPMLVIMASGTSAVFPTRGWKVGLGLALALVCAAGVAINPSYAIANPAVPIISMALLVAISLVGAAAGRSTREYRGAATVDTLTGLLTRDALIGRVAELSHHAGATGQQVAVIVADLDRFKAINDARGHGTGDEVLREAADRIRRRLRAFESAYRVGGEEFVVLLPGTSTAEAAEVAERIREVVCGEPIAGVTVTLSLGVAASDRGNAFDYSDAFRRADAALYLAKREGRDCVRRDEAARETVAA